jgi:hypothetical protein
MPSSMARALSETWSGSEVPPVMRYNALGEKRVPQRSSQPNSYAVRLRVRCRKVVRVTRAIVRNASLTARVSGKIFATSGSRRTTLVPSAYRAAVTPRTAFEKSYSSRIVSSSEPSGGAFFLLFFILLSFISSCQPSTNDSRSRRPLGVGNDQQAITVRHTQHDKSLFTV